MLKRKCPSCAKKSERKYNFCPWCGLSFKAKREKDRFGMLGRDDNAPRDPLESQVKLPFGMNGIVNSLVKQLEKQMGELNGESGKPKGFRIQISGGQPQIKQVIKKEEPKEELIVPEISEDEGKRRAKLPRKDAESKVKRLGDSIIYEVSAPGVNEKGDVVITKLEQGLEVKAYSRDKCYVKVIPLKVEVLGYEVRDEIVFVELKG
jgi:hypothetical protein